VRSIRPNNISGTKSKPENNSSTHC
jgi:hypothetical protein